MVNHNQLSATVDDRLRLVIIETRRACLPLENVKLGLRIALCRLVFFEQGLGNLSDAGSVHRAERTVATGDSREFEK
jgi:hypothetical protein